MYRENEKSSWLNFVIYSFFFIFYFFVGCNESGQHKPIRVEEVINLGETKVGVTTVASGLNVPWEIAWGPDNNIWITEQSGTISRINPDKGRKKILLVIPGVWRHRTSGLLGMALSPNMKEEPFVFVDYTFLKDDSIPFSRLVRYTVSNDDTLINPRVLLEIPAGNGHFGSRIAISPDKKIMWATGDAQIDGSAQDTTSLDGKILRINMDGSVPLDNPIKGSYVWTWGFRNMEGLVYSTIGKLYTSENGDATDDEVNLIQKNGNYGWPFIQGMSDLPSEKAFHQTHHTIDPLIAWTPTIAPSGIDYYNNAAIPEWRNSLLMVTLKAQSLRVLKLNSTGSAIISEHVFLEKKYGRLRDLCISPDGDVYISTSNRDWNPSPGFPIKNDDRIIKIFQIKKEANVQIDSVSNNIASVASEKQTIYSQYCSSCHKEDGNGVPNVFPALNGSAKVNGNKSDLISIVLNGINPKERHGQTKEAMPSFHFLNDQEIASILSYIRSQWNNHKEEITSEEVKQRRLKSH